MANLKGILKAHEIRQSFASDAADEVYEDRATKNTKTNPKKVLRSARYAQLRLGFRSQSVRPEVSKGERQSSREFVLRYLRTNGPDFPSGHQAGSIELRDRFA
ncbi:MAG: hypothetical protein IJI03_16055, partial [Rudaea sp.]|nr:hypothetical protein [Rudaea sp.]